MIKFILSSFVAFVIIISVYWYFKIEKSEDALKIACVGDSITFGHGIEGRSYGRKIWCYPSRLNRMLGKNYSVKNFGKNGATVLVDGDIPYINQPEYARARSFEPDIVVLMLGTNDSKPHNWKSGARFREDYLTLLKSFADLPSTPRIVIGIPLPVFSDEPVIDKYTVKDEIVPEIKEIAQIHGVTVIDFNKIFEGKGDLVPDYVHPNRKGHRLMAKSVRDVIESLEYF